MRIIFVSACVLAVTEAITIKQDMSMSMPEPLYYSDVTAPAPTVVAKDPAKDTAATTPTVVNTPAGAVIGTTTTTLKDAEA